MKALIHFNISLLLFFWILSYPSYSFCSESSLFLAEMEIRLGMDKGSFYQILNDKYELDSKGAIYDRTKKGPNSFVGQVMFKNDKVVYVSRKWFGISKEETLFSLIHQITQNQTKLAYIGTEIFNSPKIESQTMEILFPPHKIVSFSITKLKDYNMDKSVSINEIVRNKQFLDKNIPFSSTKP